MKQGWEYGILEDAVNKGSSNLSLKKIKGDDGDYPVFGAKGFVQNVSFYHQESEYLGIIKDGAGIGRVSRHPEKSSIIATMQYILPKKGFDIQFINYFLNNIDFEKYRTGSTIPHIYYKDYKSEPFPLVNTDEQKRIVAKLDECFEAIDKARANVEKNLNNAKELFQSQLNQIFSQKGDGWEEKKLGEVCDLISGQHIMAKDYNSDGEGIGYLTGPSDFGLDYPTISKWTEHPKKIAIKNDILITVKGSGVGSINLQIFDEVAISRQLMAIRAKNVNTNFLYSFLSIQFEYFQSHSKGAAIPGLSREDVL
ncbi:MAG: hypothetical protein CMI31_05410, partial [Opitutae bacterium]|nr:hypothetical protein [Opitutae bacterium]